MKRWIHANDSAYKMVQRRNNHYKMSQDATFQDIERMLDAEIEDYLKDNPEARDWWDDELDQLVSMPASRRFRPSKELGHYAKENGYIRERPTSKRVPPYQYFVTKV